MGMGAEDWDMTQEIWIVVIIRVMVSRSHNQTDRELLIIIAIDQKTAGYRTVERYILDHSSLTLYSSHSHPLSYSTTYEGRLYRSQGPGYSYSS